MKRYGAIVVYVLLMVVAFTSCSKKERSSRADNISVKTMKVSANTHVVGKSYMGTIEEEDGANVSFGVIGNVVRVMVEEGQFVRKGQAMASIGSTILMASPL